MRYAVFIFLFIVFGCGSSKRSSSLDYTDSTRMEHGNNSKEKSIAAKQVDEFAAITSATNIDEDIVTFWFDIEGRLRKLQTKRRETGHDELGVSGGLTSEISGVNKTDSSYTNIDMETTETEEKEEESDNRPIQSGKNMTAGIVVGFIIAVILAITIYKSVRK